MEEEIQWNSPSENANFGTYHEFDTFESPVLSAEIVNGSGEVEFRFESGELPESLIVDNDTKTIHGFLIEMDDYVEGWKRPDDFTYDSSTKSGGKYATYGSALHMYKDFVFTIRAYKVGDEELFADRTFRMRVENDYSDTRDTFIREYYEGQTLVYEGVRYTPDEYILLMKSKGYYT